MKRKWNKRNVKNNVIRCDVKQEGNIAIMRTTINLRIEFHVSILWHVCREVLLVYLSDARLEVFPDCIQICSSAIRSFICCDRDCISIVSTSVTHGWRLRCLSFSSSCRRNDCCLKMTHEEKTSSEPTNTQRKRTEEEKRWQEKKKSWDSKRIWLSYDFRRRWQMMMNQTKKWKACYPYSFCLFIILTVKMSKYLIGRWVIPDSNRPLIVLALLQLMKWMMRDETAW